MQYNEQETVTTKIQHSNSYRGFMMWLGIVSGTIIIGVATYGIVLVKQYIPIVGMVFLVSVACVPAIGLLYLIVHFAKFATHADWIEIGPVGHVKSLYGRVTEYHPLGLKEHKSTSSKQQTVKEQVQIPDLLTVLKEGLIGSVELLLGYHLDGSARFGSWDDLRTFVVAGKSRSGKTVTMVFFIVQALLAHATVYVCDPHWSKKTGLLTVIEPLIPFLQVARRDVEIINLVTDFRNEMKARVNGTSTSVHIPMLLVIDEWSKLLRDLDSVEIELLVNTVLGCAEEYAGYNGFALIAGHEWTARESGGKKGAAIRRAFHSVFVHRLDEEYAKFLLTGKNKKEAVKAPNLATGHAKFQDSEGILDYLIIPYYGKQKEGIYEVVEMLKALRAPSQPELLDSPIVPSHPAKPLPQLLEQPVTIVPETPTTNEENATSMSDQERVNLIQRLRKRNVAHRDIAYMFGLYGPKYDQYKAFCEQHDIVIS